MTPRRIAAAFPDAAGASCMELDTTTFGFAFQIRANSTIGPVAAGSDSAVGQEAFINSVVALPAGD